LNADFLDFVTTFPSSIMHPLGGGGYQPLAAGYSGMEGAQSPGAHAASVADHGGGSPAAGGDHNGGGDGQNGGGHVAAAPQYSDINQILDQILNITDQSLDEAQVSHVLYALRRLASYQDMYVRT
jgi:hypothetical protein